MELERGEPFDHLRSTSEALDWFHSRRLIHDVPPRSAAGEATLERIRRTRAALRELADATFEGRSPQPRAIDEMNRALRAREVVQLVPSPDGLRLDHRHVGDPVDDALANLATPIVDEVTSGRRDRLRACASDSCRWIFYDDSRTGGGAGATWPAAATGRRRPATGPGSRKPQPTDRDGPAADRPSTAARLTR